MASAQSYLPAYHLGMCEAISTLRKSFHSHFDAKKAQNGASEAVGIAQCSAENHGENAPNSSEWRRQVLKDRLPQCSTGRRRYSSFPLPRRAKASDGTEILRQVTWSVCHVWNALRLMPRGHKCNTLPLPTADQHTLKKSSAHCINGGRTQTQF